MKRGWAPLLVALACGALAPAARAEVWAWVDEGGRAHFAARQLDPRYELFFRGDAGETATPTPRPVQVPTATSRLLTWFEIAPGFRAVQHLLREAAQGSGLDEELLKALVATESGFDAQAVSPRGAIGLMQVMPATAGRWGLRGHAPAEVASRLHEPGLNLRIGSRYLRHLLDEFPGRLDLALAAYNAGEGAVLRAGRQVPPIRETQDYVKTVMQLYAMLRPPAAVAAAREARLPGARLRMPAGESATVAARMDDDKAGDTGALSD